MSRTKQDWKRDISILCEEFMMHKEVIREIIEKTEAASIRNDYLTKYNYAHRLFRQRL